jgi:uncharacterized protein
VNAQTETQLIDGPAGRLEIAIDRAAPGVAGASAPTVVVSHPHPLFGGTLTNKVVQTLARAFVQCGFTAVRYNFRGVGQSTGSYDEGRGELADLLAVIEHAAPAGPLALAGFSFGAFVTTHGTAQLLQAGRTPVAQVLVGLAASRFDCAPVAAELHPLTLVVHGEQDDTVPLSAVLDWARPQTLPVVVVPGVEHFFHGQLPLLRQWVVRHLSSLPAAG